MNAHKATITSIFDGTTLIEIPFFQRSYVWDKYPVSYTHLTLPTICSV